MRCYVGLMCLFLLCGNVFGEEDVERMLELYGKSGNANLQQRLREYEVLQEMRRARGERHLPAGSQFDFARESYRRVRSDAPGKTGPNGCAWTSAGPTNLNGRVTSIAIDPNDNQRIYAATVGGLWRTWTAGRRWQRVSDDFLAKVFGAIAVNPGDPNEILAGGGDSNMGITNNYAGDGIWRSTAQGAPGSWSKVTPAMFDNDIVYRILYDPDAPHDVYVAARNGVWRGVHGAGTITFNRIGGFDAATHDIAIDFSTTVPTIYAGVREPSPTNSAWGVGIHKWSGPTWNTATWKRRDSGIDVSDAETFSIAIAESNKSILYVKVSQRSDQTLIGIFKTVTAAEGANAWQPLPVLQEDAVPDERMGWFNTVMEVHPTDPDRIFAAGTRLWYSPKGGKMDWENISYGKDPDNALEAHGDVHTLAFDPTNPNIIYIGNDGGIDRSTDMSQPTWHWIDVSHGMTITMFYYLTSNREYPTLLAGGTQDNGTALTFGNRTWYHPRGCDGYDVGSDPSDPDTLYTNCNGKLNEFANPVPGTDGGLTTIQWTFKDKPRPPLITDEVKAHAALAGGGTTCGARTIVKTLDGVDWTSTKTKFEPGANAIALASAPTGDFLTYLAAVAYRPPLKPKDCDPDFVGVAFNPYVIRTDDGGDEWDPVMGLPSDVEPSAVAFDPNDKFTSYVTYRDDTQPIYISTGGTYQKLDGLSVGARNIVVDPFNTDILYVATSVGMFRGEITSMAPPTATFNAFNEGLPDGMEINDLWIDPTTGILTIGSFGFGAFRRDIRAEADCEPRMLVVRDTVYDDGREPSLTGIPDAEHPIPDLSRPGDFYKPDDTSAGKVHWWTSRDIRIDVPANDPPANQIADADSVEFDLCPLTAWPCPEQSMIDSSPQAFQEARVYVQVTNRGVEAVAKARVIALWKPSSGAFESLPKTFWTQTFPEDAPCGALDPGTQWQLVDPDNPCRTIANVTPDMPEVARFDWVPPITAHGGAAMLTIVEAPLDKLDASIREQNILSPLDLVPNSRQIALRNMNIRRFDARARVPFLWPLDLLKLPEEMEDVEVVVSKPDLSGESVRIALPAGLTAHAGVGSVRQTRVTEAELVRELEAMGLDPNNAWEFSGDEASLFVDLRPGERVTTGVIATPAATDASSRVSIMERSRGKVVGGSVMLFRPEM